MFVATPDTPMKDSEVVHAEHLLRIGEITQSDLAWLMGFSDGEEDKPAPRGFKSRRHFEAFLWHQEQKRLGRKVPRKRKKRAA